MHLKLSYKSFNNYHYLLKYIKTNLAQVFFFRGDLRPTKTTLRWVWPDNWKRWKSSFDWYKKLTVKHIWII